MDATIIFFGSLAGMSILLGLKVFELKRGVKPFSAYRYKADIAIRKKIELLLSYIKYFNRQTAKLIVLFIFSEVKIFVIFLAEKIKHGKIGLMVRGKHLPDPPSNGTNSEFLKGMSSIKEEKRNSEDSPK